jgi:hypothetical protein
MRQPGQVERLWWPRLRWRMRGAWQWPAFAALTLVDAVLLAELPFYDRGPGSFVGGLLLAGFINLFAVAIVAPVAGRWLRRRRQDLPRLVANDYAGTGALVLAAVGLAVGGVLHRPAMAAERADVAAATEDARAALQRRDFDTALAAAARLDSGSGPFRQAAALRLRAGIELARGDNESAAMLAGQSFSIWQSADAAVVAARANLRAGASDRARNWLRRALEAGAPPAAVRADPELGAIV